MSSNRGRQKPPTPTHGRVKQKLRTRTQLLMTARKLLESGNQPTITEVADAAQISRRTAYRYFPTQAKLLTEAALEGLRPIMEGAIDVKDERGEPLDVERRIDAMIANVMRLAAENESLLRTMIHQTVLEPTSPSTPKRGTRRIDWIEGALKPSRAAMGKVVHARLVSALAVCVGIEALIILRDIRGLSVAQATHVTQWMGRALLREAFAEALGEAGSIKGR